jgi:hypothetical protein
MYLFLRNARVVSGGGEVMADLVALTDFVNQNTELDTSLYSMAIGTEPGTVSWSGNVARRSDLVAAWDKLLSTQEYWDIVGRVRPHLTPPTDAMLTSIHATGEMAPKPSYVSTTWGQATGSLPKAVAWAIEMTELASDIGGAPVMLTANSIGPSGQLGFMSSAESLDELEDRTLAMWADERFMAKIGDAADMFQSGIGGASTWRKVH